MDLKNVILVNENDEATGEMEKLEVHRRGILHRAFSVFIINEEGEMLLQKRASDKYHSGGLWTNACCSHPFPGENTLTAAHRRLREELGFDCELEKLFEFTYRAELDNNLTEYEYDHVFSGIYSGQINIDKNEIGEVVYEDINRLSGWIEDKPGDFTEWFKIAFPKVRAYYVTRAEADRA